MDETELQQLFARYCGGQKHRWTWCAALVLYVGMGWKVEWVAQAIGKNVSHTHRILKQVIQELRDFAGGE